jgi:hypothetical protein
VLQEIEPPRISRHEGRKVVGPMHQETSVVLISVIG